VSGERRTGVAVALVVVAALYVVRTRAGCAAPSHKDAPEPAALLDARRAASDEPPVLDASARPSPRPLDALFLYAQVTAEPDAGSLVRLLGNNKTTLIDSERPGSPRLRELGLEAGEPDAPPRRVRFEPKAPGVPARHDELLRALAELAGPVLSGVEFGEWAPAGREGDYELTAAMGAGRVRTAALNFGRWYDLDAVLGLLNAVLRERGSPLRFVALATTDRFATVLVGPEGGIQAAAAEGLIEVGEASYAMNAGRLEDEGADAGAR
jgi:hypothetical protein